MKRNRFFAPWSELREQFRGANHDFVSALLFIVERIVAVLLSLFALNAALPFGSLRVGSALLFLVAWLGLLYIALIFLYLIFRNRQ